MELSFLFLAQQPNASLDFLILRFLTHSQLDKQPVGILQPSDQPVVDATTYTKQKDKINEHSCYQRDSNQRSQQSSGCTRTLSTAWPSGSASWTDTDRRSRRIRKRNLLFDFAQKKSLTDWPGFETGHPPWEAGDGPRYAIILQRRNRVPLTFWQDS